MVFEEIIPYPPRAPGGSRRGLPDARAACAGECRPCGSAAPRRDEKKGSSWEGAALPDPPTVGGRGNPGSPYPCLRAQPSQTLPSGEGRGNPGSPYPCLKAQPSQTLPRAGVWGNLVPPCSRQYPDRHAGDRQRTRAPLMVFEKLIRYAGLAVGLKPSARGCEGRLRGLYRIMYSKTMGEPGSPIPPPAGGCGRGPHAGGWRNRVSPASHPVGESGGWAGKSGFPCPRPSRETGFPGPCLAGVTGVLQ